MFQIFFFNYKKIIIKKAFLVSCNLVLKFTAALSKILLKSTRKYIQFLATYSAFRQVKRPISN